MTFPTDRHLIECALRFPLVARRGSTGEILRCSSFGPMLVGRNAWVLEAPLGVPGSSEAIVVSERLFEHAFVEVDPDDPVMRAAAEVVDLGAPDRRRDDERPGGGLG